MVGISLMHAYQNHVIQSPGSIVEGARERTTSLGFNVIEADNLDAAEKIAKENPYITGIRVYEIRSK